jgi:N-acyl-D-aspartate/D-glutamate deacylase
VQHALLDLDNTVSPRRANLRHRVQQGRVLDPESGLDAIRSVGITGKKVSAISAAPLRGAIEVDSTGLVIAPGFIDLHSHGQTPENYRYKAMDGVTTALELETGVSPVSEWYSTRNGKSLIHFGASAGVVPARMAVMKDTGTDAPRDSALTRVASAEERKAIEDAVKKGLEEGALGVGLHAEFAPLMTTQETLAQFELAARWRRPIFVHLRRPGNKAMESLQEVVSDAFVTGASLQVVHIAATAGRRSPEVFRFVEMARARGLDITMETYPYTAGAGFIESGMFDPGWQENRGITYSDLLWLPTGERLTKESFEHYRKQGGLVVMFIVTEDMIRAGLANPQMMIASDGRITNGQGHPRGAGTYARLLGKYVREDGALTLMDAIRKSSLMPAQRIESFSPQMRQKGRIKVGADADISVFDPNHVSDKATFENPAQYSAGFRYVMVEGTFVVRDGKLQEGVVPGRAILAR